MKQLLWAALFVLSLPSLAWARRMPGILSDTTINFLLIAGLIVLILVLGYFVILSKRHSGPPHPGGLFLLAAK